MIGTPQDNRCLKCGSLCYLDWQYDSLAEIFILHWSCHFCRSEWVKLVSLKEGLRITEAWERMVE